MNKLRKELESSEEQKSGVSSSLYTGSESDYSIYSCKYCLYGTNIIEALRRHERAHIVPRLPSRKELKPLHSCEFCSSKFVQKRELEEHRKIHAIGMVCSLCSYTSQNKNILRNHVRAHSNKRSFQCLLCSERMTSRKMLDDHLNKHVLTLSSCKWCRFTTDTPSRLKAHFQVHMKTKQKQCNFCNYICFVEEDMKEHATMHQNANANEAVVREKVQPIKSLRNSSSHEKSSNTEQEVPPNSINIKRLLKRAFFKCSICGEVQKSDEALQRHCYKHLKAQQYSCHICPFKGNNSSEIRDHFIEHLPTVDLSEVRK